ncbi:UDP-N-acetylmuramyl-tripeptide synthetase [Candidatus Kaiserbacteria bacterium]|nr:UDP-N-acetylmuramyl-tripeptide synthetase [Candidatus Kaiserbacteria bacterium]
MGTLRRIIKSILKTIVPPETYARLVSAYHLALALFGAALFGFPSTRMTVIGVTGTKGKSSTIEMISSIFEAAGYKTAVLNSIRIKVADDSRPNTMRMSMPGRFFIQGFLARAHAAGCSIAVLEMTSEGARQHRHRGLALNAFVFTNLAPEHIESHGSFEAYAAAKLELGRQLVRSRKRPRVVVANADDPASQQFLTLPVEHALPYSLADAIPWHADEHGGSFTFEGTEIRISQPGAFSVQNALAAATVTRALGVHLDAIARGLLLLTTIPGRAERIEAGQPFAVVVDYAHTPDSLKALYDAYGSAHKIGILGSTGGGRDTWKRPVMGGIADQYCDTVILTNEDPYDEDPKRIIDALASGMHRTPLVIIDRRAAIGRAIELADAAHKESGGGADIAVLITGKGTDPTIQGPAGTSVPWSDARVAHEEIVRVMTAQKPPAV